MDLEIGPNLEIPVAAQVALVGLFSAALTYATNELNYQTGLNLIWMVAIPVLLGLSCNQHAARKALMAIALPFVSLLAVATVGWMLGGL